MARGKRTDKAVRVDKHDHEKLVKMCDVMGIKLARFLSDAIRDKYREMVLTGAIKPEDR